MSTKGKLSQIKMSLQTYIMTCMKIYKKPHIVKLMSVTSSLVLRTVFNKATVMAATELIREDNCEMCEIKFIKE